MIYREELRRQVFNASERRLLLSLAGPRLRGDEEDDRAEVT